MTYFCSHCNTEHEDWPALIFNAPDFYTQLSEEEKEQALLTPDLCVIQHGGQTDRFIRCVMHQKVNEHCRDLEYGLWVSLSEKNYNEYVEHFYKEEYQAQYFGWLSNWLPGYGEFAWVKMHIAVDNTDNQRPKAFVQVVNDPDIPLVRDYFQGISLEAAQARVESIMDSD
jgi:hypothetical protein